jgi:peptidoglycan hydrolase-like protein with peptidoglycan-binding domain
MYPSGRYSDETMSLQRALILNGFDVGKDGADGIMGSDTIKAVIAAREHYGLAKPSEPRIDLPLLLALGVRSKAAPPPKKPSFLETLSLVRDLYDLWKGKPMNSTWLTSFVGTTAFKYLVAMIATYIASKLGLDKGSIEGILTQLVGVAMGVWGAWEASRSKIVIDGKKVSVSDLTTAEKNTVSNIVEDKK